MVLLTSGTISVAISSSIIGLFTFLLFLSGYVLQQQSVRNIQAALPKYTQPASTPTLPSPFPDARVATSSSTIYTDTDPESTSSPFDTLPNYKHHFQQAPISGSATSSPNSANKQAYLQILTQPSTADICSTLLFAQTVSTNSSLHTDRIVVYPESWDLNSPTANIAAALRMLRVSSEKYNLIIYPMDMSDPRDRHQLTMRFLRKVATRIAAYERILYLQSPGVVVDVQKLDQLVQLPDDADKSSQPSSKSSWWVRRKKKQETASKWARTPLSVTVTDLPSAVLILSKYLRPGVLVSHSYTLPSSTVRTYVHSVMGALKSVGTSDHQQKKDHAAGREQGYVYFEKNKNRLQERSSKYFLEWRKGLQGVCEGIDLDDWFSCVLC